MKNILVVGGSSVSGGCAVRAARQWAGEQNTEARIISTSSRTNGQVEGADITLGGIDLGDPGAVTNILDGLKANDLEANPVSGEKSAKGLDYIIYIPARGEVGIPASQATAEMVSEAVDYCIRPFLALSREMNPLLTVSLSGFITMPPLLQVYGAMSFTKIAQEEITLRHPKRLKILRIGMFHSNSVRGIALLVQRNMTRGIHPDMAELRREWKESGVKKFQEFFYQKNYRFEEESYRDQAPAGVAFRPTEPADIEAAFLNILRGEPAPIVNVLGAWYWTEDKMPPLPPVIQDNRRLIPTDLDQELGQ